MNFQEKYQEITKLVESELEQLKTEIISDFEDYINLKSYLTAPSKHIRPVLAFLYLKACGIEVTKEQIKLQSIVELIHNASLIHDDIVDNSETRRKTASINKIQGNHAAVIGGDFILSYALDKIVELNSIELLKLFNKTLKDMCKGEFSQMIQKFQIPTLEEYIEKTYQKTGSLFEASISGSLLIANKPNFDSKFAKNFGIAFQIRDDLQNITQNHSDSDILNGIYTAPVIYSNDPTDPEAGIEKATSLLENYITQAKNELNTVSENQYKRALTELTEILTNE